MRPASSARDLCSPSESTVAFYEAHPHPNVLHPLARAEDKSFIEVDGGVAWLLPAGRAAQVGGVLVDPDRRGQGLGREILCAIDQEARRLGVRWLWMGVYRRPPDQAGFYRACGYRTVWPFVPGLARAPWLAKPAAQFGIEAGDDDVRVMARRVP